MARDSMPPKPALRSRRQILRETIAERADAGQGGGIGSDWAARAQVRRQTNGRPAPIEPPRASRRRGVPMLGLAVVMVVCVAATAGGSFVLWNGQNSSSQALIDAEHFVGDPSADANLRKNSTGVLLRFAVRSIQALQDAADDPDPNVSRDARLYLDGIRRLANEER